MTKYTQIGLEEREKICQLLKLGYSAPIKQTKNNF